MDKISVHTISEYEIDICTYLKNLAGYLLLEDHLPYTFEEPLPHHVVPLIKEQRNLDENIDGDKIHIKHCAYA